jgi:hypothetical protein
MLIQTKKEIKEVSVELRNENGNTEIINKKLTEK